MSVEAMSWVFDRSATRGKARMVLLVIANHAGADGFDAWPSLATIARKANLSETSVKAALAECVALGELVVEPGMGGRLETRTDRRPNRYRVVMARGAEGCPPSPSTGVGNAVHGGNTGVPNGGNTGVREPSFEPSSLEPSLSLVAVEAKSGALVALDPFDDFWKLYPRKEGKGQARLAWGRAIRRAEPSVILAGARRFAADPNLPAAGERRFIPHPATWLNGDRWGDGPLPPRSSGAPSSRHGRSLAELHRIAQGGTADA